MAITQDTRERIIVPGPAGFHPPSAAQLGVSLPDPGQGLYYGLLEPNEEVVIEEMARKMLTSPNATIFPGPLLLVGVERSCGGKGEGHARNCGADS